MRDRDIRLALRRELESIHKTEPSTLVIEELGLCQGNARVDMVVINGFINGFEIKSERDTLERLPAQQEIYNKTLDYVTIVANGSHIERIDSRVPTWWGITEAKLQDGQVCLDAIRRGRANPAVDPLSVAQLLWRDEVLAVLKARGLEKGVLSKPRRALWKRLTDVLSIDDLREVVRQQIKARKSWRVVP